MRKPVRALSVLSLEADEIVEALSELQDHRDFEQPVAAASVLHSIHEAQILLSGLVNNGVRMLNRHELLAADER